MKQRMNKFPSLWEKNLRVCACALHALCVLNELPGHPRNQHTGNFWFLASERTSFFFGGLVVGPPGVHHVSWVARGSVGGPCLLFHHITSGSDISNAAKEFPDISWTRSSCLQKVSLFLPQVVCFFFEIWVSSFLNNLCRKDRAFKESECNAEISRLLLLFCFNLEALLKVS